MLVGFRHNYYKQKERRELMSAVLARFVETQTRFKFILTFVYLRVMLYMKPASLDRALFSTAGRVTEYDQLSWT